MDQQEELNLLELLADVGQFLLAWERAEADEEVGHAGSEEFFRVWKEWGEERFPPDVDMFINEHRNA